MEFFSQISIYPFTKRDNSSMKIKTLNSQTIQTLITQSIVGGAFCLKEIQKQKSGHMEQGK